MSKQDENAATRDASASESAALEIFEAAGSSESFTDFLMRSDLPPLEELDAASREQLGKGEEVEHTPIIITDGSVMVDLSDDEYSQVGADYVSTHLALEQVESTVRTHANGSKVCYRVNNPNEVCTVVFHCGPEGSGGGGNRTVTIQGGLSTPPKLRFDHGEFPRVPSPMPKRKLHRGGLRRINSMEIFSTLNGQTKRVHVCPLAGDGCEYRILDPHS